MRGGKGDGGAVVSRPYTPMTKIVVRGPTHGACPWGLPCYPPMMKVTTNSLPPYSACAITRGEDHLSDAFSVKAPHARQVNKGV